MVCHLLWQVLLRAAGSHSTVLTGSTPCTPTLAILRGCCVSLGQTAAAECGCTQRWEDPCVLDLLLILFLRVTRDLMYKFILCQMTYALSN